ncbi:hydrogenase maturation nickel metallochaperone HypA [Bacillus marasmi]|uniref:hydrogenase maturation nickel metallochaperone HypA/HybF n=1 Tax=Bacillus marasmi TaxID=1926279 RepID=UPI0011C76FE2|nr:hydrogenase maturation nickel metallochaperone HypA [Bacillus marasmi]
MHEMSLMGDILNIIQDDADSKGVKILQKVELVVGEISNVLPDALRMAFEIFKEQNPHFIDSSAILEIHIEAARAECVLCGSVYQPDQRIALCPKCQMPSGKVTSGEAFQVLSYEGR